VTPRQTVRELRTIEQLTEERDQVRMLLTDLIQRVGVSGRCGGCRTPIYWVGYLNGKMAAHNPDGPLHIDTCPKRRAFLESQEDPFIPQEHTPLPPKTIRKKEDES
jgi:hypothetical protein